MRTVQTKLYEVWVSRGQGIQLGPRFRLFSDAQRYVKCHICEASHAVRSPEGRWEMIAPRRRDDGARRDFAR